jgi:hypothetical protein
MTGRPPDTLRLWSLVWAPGMDHPDNHPKAPWLGKDIFLQNKADPSHFVSVLSAPPVGKWACAIADTGKIHVVPFAVLNTGNGPWCVRFERADVRSTPAVFRALCATVTELLTVNISKQSIARGDMTVAQWRDPVKRQKWTRHYPDIEPMHGRDVLRLVLFLLRRPL